MDLSRRRLQRIGSGAAFFGAAAGSGLWGIARGRIDLFSRTIAPQVWPPSLADGGIFQAGSRVRLYSIASSHHARRTASGATSRDDRRVREGANCRAHAAGKEIPRPRWLGECALRGALWLPLREEVGELHSVLRSHRGTSLRGLPGLPSLY